MTIQELHEATLTPELQASITPGMAKELLQLGNQMFVEERLVGRQLISQVKQTSTGQYPHSVILSCIRILRFRSRVLKTVKLKRSEK